MPSENSSLSEISPKLESQANADFEYVSPHDRVMEPPNFSKQAIKEYCVTRVTGLIPSKEYVNANRSLLNPIPALREVKGQQWLLIMCAFMGWTWDAFDFFTISLNVSELATELNKTTTDITWAITLVLMLRTVGAFIFGYFGDRYGTKWPFVVNLIIMMCIQIGVSFIQNFKQFLGVRALFGIAMGGIYGNATATALDDCPPRAKGFISGFLQQGYAFGYLLAVIFTRALADTQTHKWRAVYWFAACVTLIIAISRALLPETNAFLQKKAIKKYQAESGITPEPFGSKVKKALRIYWLMTIYMVLLMAGFNFMSHGSQDLFPTFLTQQLGFSKNRSTVTNCVANIGAIVGGLIVGHLSNFAGRRLSIMVCCVGGGALIYPWGFVRNGGINAAVFFLQFFVQGAFGVIPAHLSELAHPDFKAFTVGIAYQLGNLASSASSTIESKLGAQFPTVNSEGETIYNYGKVMAIFMGCVFSYNLIMTFIGPENMTISEEVREDGPSVLEVVATEKAKEEKLEDLESKTEVK